MPVSTAFSSTGSCTFDPRTGEVFQNTTEYAITQFDVAEWYETYRESSMPEEIDILDLGYWCDDPGGVVYEPPALTWREERKEMQLTGDVGVLGLHRQDFKSAGPSVGELGNI